jgi:uncharacterized protein YkwD
MRAVPVAVAGLTALVLIAASPSAVASPTEYLAPPTACAGATEAGATAGRQRSALVCLVNWARRRAGLAPIRHHRALARAAEAKAASIVSCGEFSHAPCGSTATAGTVAAGYRFAFWAENLYWGSQWLATPRAAMQAWLLSPPHREHVFARGARDAGIGCVRTSTFAGSSDVTVWVLEVGRRL